MDSPRQPVFLFGRPIVAKIHTFFDAPEGSYFRYALGGSINLCCRASWDEFSPLCKFVPAIAHLFSGPLVRRAASVAELPVGKFSILFVWLIPSRLLILRRGNPLCID